MKIAFLGCGYVANMYRLTLPLHPELDLVGVYDRERSRCEAFAALTGAQAYASMEELLAGEAVLVLNLTNPRDHYETSRALLEAGKHVYTEKPVAMELGHAVALRDLAAAGGLHLASAPCTLMSPAAQTLWRALEEGRAGRVRLAYAEMDDGPVPFAPTAKWINEAGTPWPTADEFETGCTIEHAGYVLSWLCAMWGPAESVTAFTANLVEDKMPGRYLSPADDFSVACVTFAGGRVLRLTNGIYAEHDHRLRLFGDDGVLTVDDPRSDDSRVSIRSYKTLRRKRYLGRAATVPPVASEGKVSTYRGSQTRDFCRVVADMAAAIEGGGSPYLKADFSVHITEITLACQGLIGQDAPGGRYAPTTTFEPLKPLTSGATS